MADRVVVAPRDAGVAAMASLRLELLEAMDKASPDDEVVLDLSTINNADSALAQLVIAFRHEAIIRKQRIAIEGENSKNSVAALLGCDVMCEACAFNDLKAKTSLAPAEVIPLAKAKTRNASTNKRPKV
jgi:hypothetical protein